jgi:hypothetical protein
VVEGRVLKGHGFTLLAAEKLIALKGTGFSPYINPAKSMGLYWLRKNSLL